MVVMVVVVCVCACVCSKVCFCNVCRSWCYYCVCLTRRNIWRIWSSLRDQIVFTSPHKTWSHCSSVSPTLQTRSVPPSVQSQLGRFGVAMYQWMAGICALTSNVCLGNPGDTTYVNSSNDMLQLTCSVTPPITPNKLVIYTDVVKL